MYPNRQSTNSRAHDIQVSNRMEFILDGLYRRLGWNARRTARELDLQGVDFIATLPGDPRREMFVDEKVAAHYWDRDLNTYCCELTCDTNRSGLGWFAPEQKNYYRTTHLLFVWVRAEDAELHRLNKVEVMLVKKQDLYRYFEYIVGRDALDNGTLFFCEKALAGGTRAELAEGVTLKKNTYGPEKSVNVIFSKEILAKLATFSRTFNGRDCRDAIIAEKNARYGASNSKYQSCSPSFTSFGPHSRAKLPVMPA